MKLKSLCRLVRKRFSLIVLIFLLSIVLFSASIIFFITSPYFASKIKSYASFYLTETLHKQVKIETLKISIFAPQVVIKGVGVKDVAYIKDINLFFGPLNFFRRKITIDKIDIIRPEFNILIKNNKIANYKRINLAIKSLIKKPAFSFISFAFQNIAFHNCNFTLNDMDRHILLNLKNFDLNIFKKPVLNRLFYNSSGIYFNYDLPHIFLGMPDISQVYSSSALQIHYFDGFVKFSKVRIGSDYFNSVSNGVLDLNKEKGVKKNILHEENAVKKITLSQKINILFDKISQIVSKINDTTVINFNHLSYISKNFKAVPVHLKGRLDVRLHLVGDFSKKIQSSAQFHIKNFVFSGGDIKDGFVKCEGEFGRVRNHVLKFTKINLKMFNGVVESAGNINLDENEGRFNSTLKDIDVGKLVEFYNSVKTPQFTAIAGGSVKTYLHLGKNFYVANIERINVKRPEQLFEFRNRKGNRVIYSIDYGQPVLVEGSVVVNDKLVLLKDLHASSSQSNGVVNGVISYNKSYLNIGFDAGYKELPKVNFIEAVKSRYFEPAGSGTIKGVIAGKFNRISFDFRNKFKSLYINRYTDSYKGVANVNIEPSGDVLFKKVALEEKSQRTNKGTIDFNGRIYENKILKTEYIDGKFETKNIRINSEKPSFSLSLYLNSNGKISGELGNPVVDIRAYAKKAAVYGQDISNINSDAVLTKTDLKIKRLGGAYNSAIFNIYGLIRFKPSVNKNFNYDLRLISNGVNLTNLNLEPVKKYHIRGIANLNLHIGGLFALPYISGNAAVRDIYVYDYFLKNIDVGISSSKSKMVLNLSALKNSLKTKADILLKKGYPYSFITEINLLDIDYRKTLFRLSGGIYGSGKLSNIKNSYLFAKLGYVYLKHGPFFLKNTKNIRISYVDRVIDLSGFELKGGDNYLQIRGNITQTKYNLIINDKTDLWILELFSNKIINSSGFVTGSAVIFGPKAHPQVYGFAEISKGLMETQVNPDYTVSRVFARLTFNNNLIVLEKSRFRLLNGIFSAHGLVRLSDFRPVSYNLQTNFSSAVYRESNYFYADMDGSVGYNGSADHGTIYGDIDIKKALYDKKINLSSFLLSYKKYNIIKPMIKKGTFNPDLNLLIKSDKSIFIRNNIMDTDFSARLHLIGTLYDPVLIGTANAEAGEIYFRGTKFRLSYANIDFNNPYKINPTFAVSADTDINQYIVRMNASGSLLNFNVNLSSTPPLSELDIVSMLALGAPASSVYAGSAGGIAASEAASVIGGGVEQSVTGAISSYFGFKNLSVAPSYSAITHSAAPQVTVTKTITKKMSISYSNIIASQSSQSVTLTYKLTPHISVIGVWENNELAPNNSNIYSEVGGSIAFHFRFY